MRTGRKPTAASRRATRTRARSAARTTAARRSRGWGGARANAGRPARGPIASEPHKRRPTLAPNHPVHITARVVRAAAPLRRRRAYAALRRALRRSLGRGDFRIVALVVRAHRIEALVEADSTTALARGMQGFQVAAARQLNRAHRRSGNVFPDRYRMRVLPTRAAVRDALSTIQPTERAAWPHSFLLRVELVPSTRLARHVDPDP